MCVQGIEFYGKVRWGILQYVWARLFTAIATFIMALADVYHEGQFTNFAAGYPYMAIINNVSQVWFLVSSLFLQSRF